MAGAPHNNELQKATLLKNKQTKQNKNNNNNPKTKQV